MFTDAEKIVAAKVLKALAAPELMDEDADYPLWSHNGWDMDESDLRTLRGVCRAFAQEHKIDADLPDPYDDN